MAATNPAQRGLDGVLNRVERRLDNLERRGRGFSVPVVEGVTTIAADEPPPGPQTTGTLWIDTDDGSKIYRWDGSQWVPTLDPTVDLTRNRVSVEIVSWQDPAATGDGLVVLYVQSAAPGSGMSTGDLWVDTDDNKLYRWNGSAWADQSDTQLGQDLDLQPMASTVADGRVRTWWQFSAPVPSGFGDLWVKTSDAPSTLWRWNNFDWVQVLDWSVALQQQQLEGKISTYYSATPPTSTGTGDLWYDTDNNNQPYRAEEPGAVAVTPPGGGGWVSVQDGDIVVAQETADSKNTVYRTTSPPWPDGDTGHADDVGDLWFDTSLGPGDPVYVISKSVSSGTATLVTDGDHGIVAGQSISVFGLDELNGTYEAASATADSVSYALEAPVPPDMPATETSVGYVQAQNAKPKNTPHVWDGSSWVSTQDADASAATTLSDQVLQTKTLAGKASVTATDASRAAYAADGRISISDYEPMPDDAFQLGPDGLPILDANGQPIPKQDGSMWITRTRDRLNQAINPAFTTVTTGWAAVRASLSRVADAQFEGGWAGQVVNDGTTSGTHYIHLSTRYPVSPGQKVVWSGFLKGVSGALSGYYLSLAFFDGSSNPVGAEVPGAAATLPTDAPVRLWVSTEVPAGASTVSVRVVSPTANATATWRASNLLFEVSDRLGRYFDGNSQGGSWTDPISLANTGTSPSALDGDAIIRFFTLEDGAWTEKFWTADTIASVSAGAVVGGVGYVRNPPGLPALPEAALDGRLLGDGSVPIDAHFMVDKVCSEAVAAGDLVNVWNNEGLFMVRKAKAALGYDAHGFVLDAAAALSEVKVYSYGYNPLMADLVPGTQFLSVNPGKTSSAPPTETGTLVQRVGHAIDSTTLNFTPQTSVLLA